MIDSGFTTQKRKASPSPPPDGADLKRAKLELRGEDDKNGKGHTNEDDNGNGAHSNRKDDSLSGVGLAIEQERLENTSPEKPSDNTQVTSPARAYRRETATRSPETTRPPAPAPSRRDASQEEKKRGKRLFGGLLSTLSQTTSNSQQKKRLEIERRQQERAHQQRIEDDRRRAEKVAKLSRLRKIEQVKFDEQAMQARHSNLLAVAHSLHTTYEPRLYYRPWELSKEQEHIIENQLLAAQDIIDRERHDFKLRKENRLAELGVVRPPSQLENTVGEPKPSEDTNRRSSAASLPKVHVEKTDKDLDGGEMVHDEEDTVLY
ncbi:pinin/SDK/memA/ protein conserved region-domain-containing protein [Lasiosphaeria hispida]|uniref:Pinin/SDK/memA/ protein conserved region-domain-containing protein n=1 Tax=Lasiosphaeria hispida TaxID=260671 RepID=A0AAJ0MG54_9PEZI|nr:pinin/SDK/memA/ protein conserved region-domain-containing protein [Lasiosphaeria hispida]